MLGTALCVAASVYLIFSTLGKKRALLALLGVVGITLVASLVALWISRKKAIRSYTEGVKVGWGVVDRRDSTSAPTATRAVDHDFLTREVVPAFLDSGLNQTRSVILELLDQLNMPPNQRTTAERFVDSTYDSELSKRQKVEQIVFHFASLKPEIGGRPPKAGGGSMDS
jgi:hypothetical protein